MRPVMRWVAAGLTATGLAALIAPLLLIAGATPAFACSCAPMSEQEYYEHADVVFAGRLVDREEPPQRLIMSSMDPATLTFVVSEVYKGEADERQAVGTAQSGASCGLEVSGEGPFLVYATEASDGLRASLCGGTRALAEGNPAAWPGSAPRAAEPAEKPLDTGIPQASGIPLDALWGGVVVMVIVIAGGTAWLVSRRVRRAP